MMKDPKFAEMFKNASNGNASSASASDPGTVDAETV
jgi:hypothetical protein